MSILLVGLSGLVIGCIYALSGIGITVVRRVTGVLNLAQGEFYVVGAFVSLTLMASGVSAIGAVIAAVLAAGLIACAEEVIILRNMRGASSSIMLLATVALSTSLSGAELLVWGRDPRTASEFIPGSITVGQVRLGAQEITLIAMTLIIGIALQVFIERTTLGNSMSAVAEDSEGAHITGLDVPRLRLFGLGLAGCLGGLSGGIAAPLVLVDFTMGLSIALYGLIASMLGGGSIRGSMAAGMLLGALESLTVRYGSDLYRDVVVYGLLVAVILAVPAINALKGSQKELI